MLYRPKPLFRNLLTTASAALVLLMTSGCSLLLGEKVEVRTDDSPLNGAYERATDQRATTQLGAIVADAGLPIDSWDRMYSVRSTSDSEAVNEELGTDLRWSVLPDSDSTILVFFAGDEVVYSVIDRHPRYSISSDHYATPESHVSTVEKQRPSMNGKPENYRYLEIEEFG